MQNSDLNGKIVAEGITFDDLLMLPNYAEFAREDVNLSTKLHEKIRLNLPVISAPMDRVTETEMAIVLARNGALGMIHRNLSIEAQVEMVRVVKSTEVGEVPSVAPAVILDSSERLVVGAAVGVGSDLEERIAGLMEAGADVLLVDSGHGHSSYIIDGVKKIRAKYPEAVIMAGNIATYDGAKAMIDAGADILRVGMGPGSICTTRIVTGMGVPQITAVAEAVRAVKGTDVTVVADGGIKQMGDIAKALGMGAHAVMMGSLFSGFQQSPGEVITVDAKQYKQYRGMGSVTAMAKGGAERYGQDANELKKKLVPEGVEGLVPFKGDVADYLHQIKGSLRSAFYYLGSQNLGELHEKAKFIKITPASMSESKPHSISITDAGSNYNK